jgi:hypothetical protein
MLLITLLDDNEANAAEYCCVSKETQQRCTIPLLQQC